MSALTPEEQELFDATKAALPRFLFQKDDAPQESFGAGAKVFKLAKDTIAGWLSQSFILTATGFWLDQHAIDRGSRRQSGESDVALRARLRQVEDAVTLPALQSAVDAVLAAAGVAGTATIIENHSAHAFFKTGSPAKSFWGRGERWGGGPQYPGSGSRLIVIILPFGTPDAVASSIRAVTTRKKGAGYAPWVEVAGHAFAPRASLTPPSAHVQVNVGATATFTPLFVGLPGTSGVQQWAVDGIVGGNSTVGTIVAGVYAAPTSVPNNGQGIDHDITCSVTYAGGSSATVVARARVSLYV